MKNLEQQPMSEDKKSYIDNEDKLAALKAKPVEDLSMEEFKALKEAKQANEGLVDKAQEEAGVEDAERKSEKEGKIYDEAKAEDAAFEQKKAAESALQLAEDARLSAAKDAEAAAKVLEGIQGTKTETGQSDGSGESPDQTRERWKKAALDVVTGKRKLEKPNKQETVEDIYGMDIVKLDELLETRGFLPEPVKANDPKVEEKMEEFYAQNRKYDKARVMLFDRVEAGVESEEEMKLAEKHAAKIAKIFKLDGFHNAVPKSWYSNERIANAMAGVSKGNMEWVEYVKKNYSNEDLLKGGYEKIGKDGFAHTYSEAA